MPHIRGVQRDAVFLFPPSLDEYITDDNPVRFIDAFVEQLDLHQLGFLRAVAAPLGRPAYHPADLLKLYIYGYLNRLRSSRLLERETRRNLELMWLLKKLTPDFKTIADFRKDNLVEVVVDSKHKLIVTHEVTTDVSDQEQLAPMAKQATTVLGVEEVDALADKGFYNGEQVKQCDAAGIHAYISKPHTLVISAKDCSPKMTFAMTNTAIVTGARKRQN